MVSPAGSGARWAAAVKKKLTIIAEHHADGWVAYPTGLKGLIVGLGKTSEGAVEDVRSGVKFRVATFGEDSLGLEKDDLE